MSTRALLVTLANPRGLHHGGEVRVQSLRQGLEANGVQVEELVVPQAPTGESGPSLLQLAGRVKRSFFPQPFLRPASRIVASIGKWQGPNDIVLSTVPHVSYALARAGLPRLWGDFFDLPYRYAASEAMFRSRLTRKTAELQASMLEREHRRAAAAMITSYAGYGDAVAAAVGHATPSWLPTVVQPPEPGEATGVPGDGRLRAGFLANFHYWPNRDAFDVLVEEWLPALSNNGLSVIVGGFGSNELPRAHGAHVIGPVERPGDFYRRVDVALVPVRRGSGIKVKAVEGLLWNKRVLVHGHVMDGLPPVVSDALDPWAGPASASSLAMPFDAEAAGKARRGPTTSRTQVARIFSEQAVVEEVAVLVERLLGP